VILGIIIIIIITRPPSSRVRRPKAFSSCCCCSCWCCCSCRRYSTTSFLNALEASLLNSVSLSLLLCCVSRAPTLKTFFKKCSRKEKSHERDLAKKTRPRSHLFFCLFSDTNYMCPLEFKLSH